MVNQISRISLNKDQFGHEFSLLFGGQIMAADEGRRKTATNSLLAKWPHSAWYRSQTFILSVKSLVCFSWSISFDPSMRLSMIGFAIFKISSSDLFANSICVSSVALTIR